MFAMKTADFDFALPPELIAQVPAARRDESRLMVLSRMSNSPEHRKFSELPELIRPGDVVVLNDSRVLRARLRGINTRTGGHFELLLLTENGLNDWWAMLRPGKRAQPGTVIQLLDFQKNPTPIQATVTEVNPEGHRRLLFTGTPDILHALDQLGELPLPPYIKRDAGETAATDLERYQTVYSSTPGSVAAPTAGLHFTPEILAAIRARGATIHPVTLHVGLGTFAPVKADSLADHIMHEERFTLSNATAEAVNRAKREGRRVIAIGTTSVRVLESAVDPATGEVRAQSNRTRIFIHPPYRCRVVDALLTNFHLPCSTLLMLVSAFAAPGDTSGRERILDAYREAVRERYRFFSYGDAMFIA